MSVDVGIGFHFNVTKYLQENKNTVVVVVVVVVVKYTNLILN